MDAESLLLALITAHRNNSPERITLCPGLDILPQFGYSGKMARDAYRGYRQRTRSTRTHAGILDFKIIVNQEGMEHEILMGMALGSLGIGPIREIRSGRDPNECCDPTDEKRVVANGMQAAFMEQEINWGEDIYQLSTYFGNPASADPLLRISAPRDYKMAFVERSATIMSTTGFTVNEAVAQVTSPFLVRTFEARNRIILPPLDDRKHVLSDFVSSMPVATNGRPTPKWTTPFTDEIHRLCEEKGRNPW